MIIDAHTHITCKGFPEFQTRINRTPFTADILLKRMDMEGIDKSLVLPLVNPENLDYYGIAGNQEVILECKKHSDRLIPCCNIDARSMLNKPGSSEGLRDLMRIFKDLGCVGIGEICSELPFNHPLMKELYHWAGKEKMPMIFHVVSAPRVCYGVYDRLHLPRLEECLKEFPDSIFAGHAPAFWNEIGTIKKTDNRDSYIPGNITRRGKLWQLVEKYPNLYCDISAGSGHKAISRDPEKGYEFLQKFNKQILFGTDRFSSIDEPHPAIIAFLKEARESGKITRNAYDNITFKNFKRVFKVK